MTPRLLLPAAFALTAAIATGAQHKIYWGDDVPAGWTGTWPAELQTVAERSRYTRTMSSISNIEFVTALRGRTESMHVVNMFTTSLRKTAPAMILATPRVTTPQEARASRKPVVFLFGNIHRPEAEAAKRCR